MYKNSRLNNLILKLRVSGILFSSIESDAEFKECTLPNIRDYLDHREGQAL